MAGFFTIADLRAIWLSACDPLYTQPFTDAGDGGGLEAYNQAFAQYERVSQAIDRTMQSMFVLPHSSQTSEPASGDQFATATLELRRQATFHVPVVFTDRAVSVEERATDWSDDGPVLVLTGRRYYVTGPVVFEPGAMGPLTTSIEAQSAGYSFNNPEVGGINSFVQPGAGQTNARASIVSGNGADILYTANEHATLVPGSVGQYVILSSPMNDGKIRRVISYTGPSTAPVENGGSVGLAQDMVITIAPGLGYLTGEPVYGITTGATGTLLKYNGTTGLCIIQRLTGIFATGDFLVGDTSSVMTPVLGVSTLGCCAALQLGIPLGMWIAGEQVTDGVSGATGTFLYLEDDWAIVSPIGGTFVAGNPVTGAVSTVTLTPIMVGVEPSLVDEAGTVTWRVLRWGDDLGFTAANTESPTGGRLGMLDELGRERQIARHTGEDDDHYRRRIGKLPDVVSPNAIRRAIARFMSPHGWVGEFREVGTAQLPGFFYDVPVSDAPGFSCAWDMDFTARPADRFKVLLDYADFRAYFMVGVPRTGLGEFGFAYDAHPLGFYDIAPLADYYDGSPAGEGAFNQGLWNDVTARKAGGVGFDFYVR